jgi:hypothetical protein
VFNYKLKSRLSPAYWLGNTFSPGGLGYIADLFTEKKCKYASHSYFNYDSIRRKLIYSSVILPRKNELRLKAGWSLINVYRNNASIPHSAAVTPLGVNLQTEYFLSHRFAVMAELGAARGSNFFRPKRLDVTTDSFREHSSSNMWLTVMPRYHYNRLSVGAGIGISFFSYNVKTQHYPVLDTLLITNGNSTDTIYNRRFSNSDVSTSRFLLMGASLNADYALTSRLSAGVNWQLFPRDLGKRGAYISHFVSFYAGWQIASFKQKRKKIK